MKKKYDIWEIEQARNTMQSNPYESLIKFEEYIRKYPEDYGVYQYYISNLITLRELEKASKLITKLEEENIKFPDNKQAFHFYYHLLENRIKLLIYQEKYDEAYKLCIKNKDKLSKEKYEHIRIFLASKTGNLIKSDRDDYRYLYRQIIDYQKEDFLKNMKKHLATYSLTSDIPSTFNEDFNLEYILKEIEPYLSKDNALYPNFYDNMFLFRYDNCGKINNMNTDYFYVTCFHNTKNIITMCPSTNTDRLPYIDLNHLQRSNTTPKTKKLSQIDKFKKRYNN